jgi:hypothetical protein
VVKVLKELEEVKKGINALINGLESGVFNTEDTIKILKRIQEKME